MTHFKSVVDAREIGLGCGVRIVPGDGTYVVARYSLGPRKQFRFNDDSPTAVVRPRKEPGEF